MSTRLSDDARWNAIRGATGLLYLFLLLPLFIVVLISFNPTQYAAFPPEGLSLTWYQKFFASERLLDALVSSFVVAAGSALVAGAVGLISAIGFVRRDFQYKSVLSSLLFLPMLISPVVIGVALTAFLTDVGMQKNYLFLILGHSTLVLPYVFVTVRAQLFGFDRSIEEAALTLGANELETFVEVTLPSIMPGLAAGMLLAFVISFGEFTATQFWVQPDTVTAPIEIYTMVRTSLTPEINAMATVLMIITVVIPLLLDVALGKNLILKSA
ncbi:ABC transporter permease [Haloarcula salina]|uniref:ABC transporter permease n=1 Tax=Haloarcula salina TaxID=1429914 RepID=A0AA41G1R8_9EURY|nr:ABC transporter permease [Haloarcula salina]MBV0902810.1 ABC transporter permease [Haloarcula salina]